MMFREGLLIRTLVQLADNLVADFDVIDVLTMLSDRCVDILDVDTAGVMLVGPGGTLQVVASSTEAMRILELFEVQASEGPCIDCFRTGEPIVDEELSATDGRWPRFAPQAIDAGFHSVHAVPMRLRGRTVGAINLFRTSTGALRETDMVAARALADVATIAIVQNHTAIVPRVLSDQLSRALYSRTVIERAKGIISEATGQDMDHAFRQLRLHAHTHDKALADLSLEVVEGSADPRSLEPRSNLVASATQARRPADRPSSGSIDICLVEDNDHLRAQLQEILLDAGMNVVAAVGTARDAEAAIAAHSPDVAVIDHRLPDGSGTDLIRALSRTTSDVRLLLYSSGVTDDETRAALDAGASAVIRKSVRVDDLLEAILSATGYPRPERT
jgi:CheY-like chemotaxis protein